MSEAESTAEGLIEDFNLTLPIKPREVCERISHETFPIEYAEKTLETDGVEGMAQCLPSGGALIIVNNKIDNAGRRTFTAAHELGHVLLHIQACKKQDFECSNKTMKSKDPYEKEANQFASSLLMPKAIIGKRIILEGMSWRLIQAIMNECGTSLEATARRVVSISDEQCALVIHKNGEMWRPIKSKPFESAGFFIRKAPFCKELDTSEDLPSNQLFDELWECEPSDWGITGKDLPGEILYHSIHNKEYDRTMSLIVIPEIEEDDEEVSYEPRFQELPQNARNRPAPSYAK